MMGCEELDILKRKVNHAREVTVYSVAEYPTEIEVRDSLKLYVLGYEVLDTLTVTKEKEKELKEAFSTVENYDTLNQKRCPFLGKYAVLFDDDISTIISTEDCAKIKAFISKRDSLYTYDLISENTIHQIVGSLEEE